MRNEAINLKFSLSDVTTRYFKDLPQIRSPAGSGLAQGDRFDLKLEGASISWGDGQKLDLPSREDGGHRIAGAIDNDAIPRARRSRLDCFGLHGFFRAQSPGEDKA